MADANVLLNFAFSQFFLKWIHQVYMTTLVPASVQYYTIPTVSLTGDFVIEVEVMVPDVSIITTASMVLGNSATTNNGMWITAAGNVVVRDNVGVTHTSEPGIVDLTLHRIRYEKVSGSVTGYIDGVEVEPAVAFGSFIFDRIGVRQASAFPFSGIIRNLRIWSEGVLIRDYRINEASGTAVLDHSGNDQHGTAVNLTGASRELFIRQPDGSYLAADGDPLIAAP